MDTRYVFAAQTTTLFCRFRRHWWKIIRWPPLLSFDVAALLCLFVAHIIHHVLHGCIGVICKELSSELAAGVIEVALQKNAMAHFYFERESVDFAKYPASFCLLQYIIQHTYRGLRPVSSLLLLQYSQPQSFQ